MNKIEFSPELTDKTIRKLKVPCFRIPDDKYKISSYPLIGIYFAFNLRMAIYFLAPNDERLNLDLIYKY